MPELQQSFQFFYDIAIFPRRFKFGPKTALSSGWIIQFSHETFQRPLVLLLQYCHRPCHRGNNSIYGLRYSKGISKCDVDTKNHLMGYSLGHNHCSSGDILPWSKPTVFQPHPRLNLGARQLPLGL